jgi:hypothetical protein
VLLAKEEMVLQGMIDRLVEIGRCYRMEMNVEETKVMRISRQLFAIKIMVDQKQLENVENVYNLLINLLSRLSIPVPFRICINLVQLTWSRL